MLLVVMKLHCLAAEPAARVAVVMAASEEVVVMRRTSGEFWLEGGREMVLRESQRKKPC